MTTKQGLDFLELATAMTFGADASANPLPSVDPGLDPLRALEEAVIPFLETPPCVVSFSGGRDSSAILAVAVRAARREGLDLPIPVTLRYPDEPATDESEWQELVVRHLEVHDWERVELAPGERDLLGPLARRVLNRHGILYPFGIYGMLPVFERATGGAVVTGEDGDGLFDDWSHGRALGVLTGRLRPEARDLRRVAKTAAPRTARWLLRRRFRPAQLAWLRPAALVAFQEAWADEEAGEPRRWDRRVAWWARRRHLALLSGGFNVVAGDYAVRTVHPFLDPHFLSALARRGGHTGFGDRSRAMRAVFGAILPEVLIARADKADFTNASWGPQARAFVTGWRGGGIPTEVVDDEHLRGEWAKPLPDARTSLLLHAAWLAESGARHVEQPVDRLVHEGQVEGPTQLPAR